MEAGETGKGRLRKVYQAARRLPAIVYYSARQSLVSRGANESALVFTVLVTQRNNSQVDHLKS